MTNYLIQIGTKNLGGTNFIVIPNPDTDLSWKLTLLIMAMIAAFTIVMYKAMQEDK